MKLFTALNLPGLLLVYLTHCAAMSPASPSTSKNITAKAFSQDRFIAPSGKVVAKWVPVSFGGHLLLNRQEPAGLEDANPLYLCRGRANNNRNKPGKLFIDGGNYYCIIPEYGEIKRQYFDLLEAPVGATSWIPYKEVGIPFNAIVAGTNPDGTTAFVCRATSAGALLVGTLDEGKDGCFVPRDGEEHVIWNNHYNNIEILVVNAYGLAL